jgi:hypothetical protein
MIHIQAKGAGGLIAVVGILSLVVVFVLSNIITGYLHFNPPDDYYQFIGGCGFLLAGIVNRAIPLELEKQDDKQDVLPSSFMYIPVKYWPHIYALGGLIIMADAANNYYKWV